MDAKIQFVQVTPKELEQKITAGIKRHLDDFLKHYKPIQPAEYLTRQQVAKMFDVDLSTIHNWSKSGKICPRALGSRIYFLRSEIDACLIPLNQ
jgi:hypothetical protein